MQKRLRSRVLSAGCAILTVGAVGCAPVAFAAEPPSNGPDNGTSASQNSQANVGQASDQQVGEQKTRYKPALDQPAPDQQASKKARNDQSKQSQPTTWRPPQAAKLVSRSQQNIRKYPLIVRPVNQAGGLRGNLSSIRTIDGRMATRIYQLRSGSDPGAVISAYQNRLAGRGYQVLFKCRGQACGASFGRLSPGARNAERYFGDAGSGVAYLLAQKQGAAGDRYVVVQTGGGGSDGRFLLVSRVETQPIRIAGIQITAQKMARDIAQTGRVALYGLYFGFDSARLKSGSESTLEQIAKLLRNRTQLDLLVVGHTDSRGSFQYNLDLSRRRAQAVVDALVDNYGIDPARLKPWGVAGAAPRATNRTELGRARNRRVELVPH